MYLRTTFLLIIGIAYVTASCVTVVNRSEWGAKSPKKPLQALKCNPAPTVVIHHSASPGCTSKDTCKTRIQGFQKHHKDVNNWDDIGYNFLIGGDGAIYEGRGWGKSGSHAPQYNSQSIGIVFIGTYGDHVPSKKMTDAAKKLIECGVKEGYIDKNYSLIGHRQTKATDCPGEALYNEIKTWTKWNKSPKVKSC